MAQQTKHVLLELLKNTEDGMTEFKHWLNTELHRQIVTVVFIKKDGTERTMRSTLNVSVIPIEEQEKIMENANKTRKVNPEVRSVYDVEAGAWKSFRWDSVKSVTYNDGVM